MKILKKAAPKKRALKKTYRFVNNDISSRIKNDYDFKELQDRLYNVNMSRMDKGNFNRKQEQESGIADMHNYTIYGGV